MNDKNPTISVIMAFYNCWRYLDEAIKSILNQTFKDFEFIIINDASTDNSEEIINKYLWDDRIKYIKNTSNKWKPYNCNLGINNSNWEYIAIMDWDDISDKTRLEKQFNFLKNNPDIDVVWTQQTLIDSENNVIWELLKPVETKEIKKSALLFQVMNHPTMLVKAEVIKKLMYREEFYEFEDNDLYMRMFLWWFRGYNLPEKLYLYRIYSWNVNEKWTRKKALNYFKCQKNVIKISNYSPTFKEKFFMYWYLITGYLLNPNQQRKLQKFIKGLIYPRKNWI